MEFSEILKAALELSLTLPLLIIAVRWLNRDRDKLLDALNTERNERIDSLESSAARCAQDRMALHSEMLKLQDEVRGLYRDMLRHSAKERCDAGCVTSRD